MKGETLNGDGWGLDRMSGGLDLSAMVGRGVTRRQSGPSLPAKTTKGRPWLLNLKTISGACQLYKINEFLALSFLISKSHLLYTSNGWCIHITLLLGWHPVSRIEFSSFPLWLSHVRPFRGLDSARKLVCASIRLEMHPQVFFPWGKLNGPGTRSPKLQPLQCH